jgi:hypothetical protein
VSDESELLGPSGGSKSLSELYYAAATVTLFLGLAVAGLFLRRHFDDIVQTFENVMSWISANDLAILACLFPVSLAVTGLAEIGLV